MEVKSCPKECKFNWIAFHRLLDIALAHAIEEANISISGPTLELIKFSNAKSELQKQAREKGAK